jgi:hypothetical protein
MQSSFGTTWRAIDDRRAGGASSARIEASVRPGPGTAHALRVFGEVKLDAFAFPFAGAALPLGEIVAGRPTPRDLSAHRGLRFWCRGDGKRYMLRFQLSQVRDFNVHHFVFTPGKEWRLVDVPFSALVQFPWGKPVPWTAREVSSLLITNYSAPGEEFGRFELQVDDITLY